VRLTVYTDYALRLLMYLAVKTDGLATISDVATSYGISKNHLMKVAHQLGQAGYVATVRGRSGGLTLGKPAGAIGLGEVVRLTEPDMDIVPCFHPENQDCPLRRSCRLRAALDRARSAFLAALDDYTLADLTVAPQPMRVLLGMREPLPAAAGQLD
jgi:Rrf2 family nitric oxide-sensitive transcriptional repressor